MAEPKELTHTDLLMKIAETLQGVQAQAQQGTDVGQALKDMTKTLAELATRTRPENAEGSGISAYSHPEGDYKHPKTPLQCDMFWVGYPLTLETLTPGEVAALNRLKPGAYRVTKANGIDIPMTVDAKYKQGGALDQLWVNFPCKGDQMHDHRSMVDYCREAMGETVPTLAALEAQVARLTAQLQAGA